MVSVGARVEQRVEMIVRDVGEAIQFHGTLSRYRTQRQQHGRKAGERNRLVPVEVSGDRAAIGSSLTIVLSAGRRIEVSLGFDPATLRQLLSVLESA